MGNKKGRTFDNGMGSAPMRLQIPVGAIRVQETITVTKKADSTSYGSCNACTSRDGGHVTVIDLRGMSIRLCDPCTKILKKAL